MNPPCSQEVRFEEMSHCRCFGVFRSSNAVLRKVPPVGPFREMPTNRHLNGKRYGREE
jgi:hypothetical protein